MVVMLLTLLKIGLSCFLTYCMMAVLVEQVALFIMRMVTALVPSCIIFIGALCDSDISV